ncbi:MAG: hypothetical protein ACFB50_15695 [Rubrobacteraceae bacterium]
MPPAVDPGTSGTPGDRPDQGTGRGDLENIRAFFSDSEAGDAALASGFVKNTVGLNRYDVRLFQELLKGSEELRGLAKAQDAPDTFGPLLLDIFSYLFKVRLEFLDESQVEPACYKANTPFISRMAEDDQTSITRLSTCMDEVASGLATVEAGKKILEELRRNPDLREWIEAQTSTTDPSPTEPPPTGDAQQARPQDSGSQADPAASQPPDLQSNLPAGFAAKMRALVRGGMEAASTEASEHASALRSWGLEPRDLRTVGLGERLDLARKLRTQRMRNLADLLGKMRNQRRATERRKVRASRDEVYDVATSGDLARTLPSERAAAFGSGNPNRKRDFYRRLSEKSVLSYSLRTKEPVGRGPVIAMIDSSYSMNGEPMEWASAVALALAHAAGGPGGRPGSGSRSVYMIFFNAQIVREIYVAPGEKDVSKLLEIGTVDAAGGTEYIPPISRALEILAENTAQSKETADLLLVTDGLCELPEAFAARLGAEQAAHGFKLACVLVGDGAREGEIGAFSDPVIKASDLARASGARDAAAQVFENL